MIKIYYKKVDKRACDNALLSNVILSEQRKEKALACRNITDRYLSVAATLLVQEALNEWTGCEQEPFCFAYDTNGKPCFSEDYVKGIKWGTGSITDVREYIYVNLSHSGEYVACAIGDEAVGIDIQKLRGYKEALAKRYFHKEELACLLNAPTDDKESIFYRIWTRKEAYIKYTGLGMKQDLSLFSVLEDNGYVYEDITDIEGYALSVIKKQVAFR